MGRPLPKMFPKKPATAEVDDPFRKTGEAAPVPQEPAAAATDAQDRVPAGDALTHRLTVRFGDALWDALQESCYEEGKRRRETVGVAERVREVLEEWAAGRTKTS